MLENKNVYHRAAKIKDYYFFCLLFKKNYHFLKKKYIFATAFCRPGVKKS